ncbi:MAG: hypothetical protein R2851_20460 [Caldilineaceae bacterium]
MGGRVARPWRWWCCALFSSSDFLGALGRMLLPCKRVQLRQRFVSDIGRIFADPAAAPACYNSIGGGVLWSVTGRLGQWLVERVSGHGQAAQLRAGGGGRRRCCSSS